MVDHCLQKFGVAKYSSTNQRLMHHLGKDVGSLMEGLQLLEVELWVV